MVSHSTRGDVVISCQPWLLTASHLVADIVGPTGNVYAGKKATLVINSAF